VDTAREPRAWRFWRACEADTVGSLSREALAMQSDLGSIADYVRDIEGDCVGRSWLSIAHVEINPLCLLVIFRAC
jgi:hypothetical protein